MGQYFGIDGVLKSSVHVGVQGRSWWMGLAYGLVDVLGALNIHDEDQLLEWVLSSSPCVVSSVCGLYRRTIRDIA